MSKKKSAPGKARAAAKKSTSARSKSKPTKVAKGKARAARGAGSQRVAAKKKSVSTRKTRKPVAKKKSAKGKDSKAAARKATRRVAPKSTKARPSAKARGKSSGAPAKRKSNNKFVSEVEEVLRLKLEELDGRIREKLEEHMKFHENRSNDPTDVASDAIDDEMALQVAEAETRERIQIREAFEKVAAGTYGSCERCGSRIPVARLRALPSASMCLKCKELEEEYGPGFFDSDDDLDGDED